MKRNIKASIMATAAAFIATQMAVSAQAIRTTTTTLAPGTQASVKARKIGKNTVFQFKIPSGLPGLTGAQGPQGPQGPQGVPGLQGPAGTSGSVIHTPLVSQGASNFVPPPQNSVVVDFGNGVALVRDGTFDGLRLLATRTTTGQFVATVTVADPAVGFVSCVQFLVSGGTLANTFFQVVPNTNTTASVRIVAGDPGARGVHTVVELHRDSFSDFRATYIGTVAVQGAQ
jgi:hypothetical protein